MSVGKRTSWVWVSHDGAVLARGRRDLVEIERQAYERSCREQGIVAAVTYIRCALSAVAGEGGDQPHDRRDD